MNVRGFGDFVYCLYKQIAEVFIYCSQMKHEQLLQDKPVQVNSTPCGFHIFQ